MWVQVGTVGTPMRVSISAVVVFDNGHWREIKREPESIGTVPFDFHFMGL
jgi:hypothetical protein